MPFVDMHRELGNGKKLETAAKISTIEQKIDQKLIPT